MVNKRTNHVNIRQKTWRAERAWQRGCAGATGQQLDADGGIEGVCQGGGGPVGRQEGPAVQQLRAPRQPP